MKKPKLALSLLIAALIQLPSCHHENVTQIGTNFVGELHLGMSDRRVKRLFKDCTIENHGGEDCVFKSGRFVLQVGYGDHGVNKIEIISRQYSLPEGIHVGDGVEKIRNAFPLDRIYKGNMERREYFLPKEYQTDSTYLSIEVISTSYQPIGNYDDTLYRTFSFGYKTSGRIMGFDIGYRKRPSLPKTQEERAEEEREWRTVFSHAETLHAGERIMQGKWV